MEKGGWRDRDGVKAVGKQGDAKANARFGY
jgi:hypothetical protein